ncbi:MAG: DapH/DapD/GlmU-related protein [Burkholderiaceae bacterium]
MTIGDDVWIGGGSVICPGVTIGARPVIAAGNPCRVLRAGGG